MTAGVPPALSPALVQAFWDTLFSVEGLAEPLRIGVHAAATDEWLTRQNAQTAVVITAYNPFAQETRTSENEARQSALLLALRGEGWRYFAAEGQGIDGAWPAEPSVCVLDVPELVAKSWLVRLRQLALVAVRRGHAPELAFHPEATVFP